MQLIGMHELGVRDSRDDRPELQIGYVGGGSQGWAHTLINDLAQTTDLSGSVALYDVDIGAAERNAALANGVMDREDVDGTWTFTAHEEMEAALADADFVICSIQDPPAETFKHDLDIPQEYGIYQTVGDTVGPGGTMRALRAVPQYRAIADTVRSVCPDAWVINYTNPMTVCTRALYAEYPSINAIGLCHEVFPFQELFADIAQRYGGVDREISRSEIDLTVKGINHCTWIDEASWQGHDLFGHLDAELTERSPLPANEPGSLAGESYWVNNFQIAFDLYDRFGVLGAAGDRHLAEFVPWYLDIDEPSAIERWGIRLTPSSARVGDEDGPDKLAAFLDDPAAFELTDSGEEVVDIMRALCGLEPIKTHLNHPNVGQISNLPDDVVVETNALITGSGVTPLCAGSLPSTVRSIVETHVTNQETLITAGFDGDLDLAFQAFLNDPLVTIRRADAQELFSRLVEVEREYLSAYDCSSARVLQE